MSHNNIYKFFNELDVNFNIEELRLQYFQGTPVHYLIIDNFLPEEIFHSVTFEIDFLQPDQWTVFSNEKSYRKECRNLSEAARLQSMAYSFQGSLFLNWIEKITDHEKLIADPHMRGGGICRVSSGHSLGLHNDFNWNEQIRLTRRLNLILYMNTEWDESWGGDLEFWNFERTECVAKISPTPNRLVIWDYDERLIHGHPTPLTCPEDIHRQNFIQFYYSSNATHETPPHRSQFL